MLRGCEDGLSLDLDPDWYHFQQSMNNYKIR